MLVNNAGGVTGQEMRPIEEVPDADWDGSGRIVNISSGAGLGLSLTGIRAYCSAKHAVVGLTRQLAHELGPFGITVNSVAPGFVAPTRHLKDSGLGTEGNGKRRWSKRPDAPTTGAIASAASPVPVATSSTRHP